MFLTSFSALVCAIVILTPSLALAAPPQRYIPAPAGKPYFMLNIVFRPFVRKFGFSEFKSSETADIHPLDAGKPRPGTLGSTWGANTLEIGTMAGYGVGSLWFLRSMDLSLYLPFYFRDYTWIRYLVTSDSPPDFGAAWSVATLHPSLKKGAGGKGIGDVTLGAMALLFGDPGAGSSVSGALKISLPSSPSAHESFVKILHGEETSLGGGAGVPRLIPALSAIKKVAGQRVYLNLEYALPLGTETFSFFNPSRPSPPGGEDGSYTEYTDSNKKFDEEIKLGGTIQGTLGLKTTLNYFGVTPGIEVNFRKIQKASWKENGVDGTAPPQPFPASQYPTHTPEFLRYAAWAIGDLALKDNTEMGIGLVGTARIGTSDLIKFGVSYITNSFGPAIEFKIVFMSLFVEKPEDESVEPGDIRVKEVEFSPVLAAPPPPTGRIRIGVTLPAFGVGISQEELDWVVRRLRREMRRLRGYDLMSEKEMAQLASRPCGDVNCGTNFGRALNLQAMVVSRLYRVGDPQTPGSGGFALTVQLINVNDGTVSSSEAISATRLKDLKPQLPDLFQRMTEQAPPLSPTN